MNKIWKFLGILIVSAAPLLFLLEVMAAEAPPTTGPIPQAPAGTDLAVEELILSPNRFQPRQPATVTVKVRNTGDTTVAGRRVYIYIDPPDRPPRTTTPATKEFVVGIQWPPGDEMTVEYAEFTLNVAGCDHVVYAWVDPLDRIPETDETNNLKQIDFCVNYPGGVSTGPDAYEDDDVCDQAQAITTDGTSQIHNFAGSSDVDWAKFQVTQGVTYTVTAAGVGADAFPNLELWESCNAPPPGAFGTTAQVELVAPRSGTFYARIDNSRASTDPVQTSYELSVHASNGGASSGPLPTVLDITPQQATNDHNVSALITGTNFDAPTVAELCRYENNTCNLNTCGQLLDVSWSASQPQNLWTVIQANAFDPGDYCVAVTNQGGRRGYLSRAAFTVLPIAPEPHRVAPSQAYNDVPTDIHVYGFNFAPGMTFTLGSTPLTNVTVVNRTHARATVPAGLTPGVYTLHTAYLTATASLPNAFTVLQVEDDLFAQAQELWTDPVAPHAQEPAKLSVLVHRQDGAQSLADIPVRFTANGQVIGDAVVPLLAPDAQSSSEWLTWTPSQAGVYTITAHIDPNNSVPEASEANNLVTQTITVLPPSTDTQPPRVDSLTTTSGRDTFTQTVIYLNATATDFPQPGGSGVAELRYIEFEHNQGSRLWLPVQDSQWLPAAQAGSNYRWNLTTVGGIHFIQAWARDGAGNVSTYPYQMGLNYAPPVEQVGRDQTRIYRRSLAAGDSLEVTLRPLSGDADLYIWPPNWREGAPPWVSNRSGTAVDSMTIAAAPVSGTYQIEVYGYSPARYEISIRTGTAHQASVAAQSGGRGINKTIPSAPVIDPNSEPPRNLPQSPPAPSHHIYLPLTRR